MTAPAQRSTQGRGRLYVTVVEVTSGNTGIGLAMVCAEKDYPRVVTMADSFSVERRRLTRFLGAKVVLTSRTPEEDALSPSTPGFQMPAA